MSSNILDREIITDGYVLYRCDRVTKGGGVLIAVSKKLHSKRLPTNPDLEMVAIEISQNIIVLCTYVSPSCSDYYFESVLQSILLLPENARLLVLGDFNAPDISWDSLSGNCSRGNRLCDIVFVKNLTQLLNEPTHQLGNILDLLLTNCPDLVNNITVENTLHSDHCVISFTMPLKVYNHYSKAAEVVPCYSRANFEGLAEYLLESDSSELFCGNNIDDYSNSLLTWISDASRQFIPQIQLPRCLSPKWFNSTIRHALNKVHTARRKWKKKPCRATLSKLKLLEEELEVTILHGKEDYIASLIDTYQSNSSKLYRYIKDLSNPIPNSTFVDSNSTTVRDPIDVCEAFNKFFNSTFVSSNYVLPSTLPAPTSHLSSISISITDTFEALAKLDPEKAMGCDNLSPRILRACASSLCEPITVLFNKTLDSCTLPSMWKLHKITPIPKSGDKSMISNYRPISLLCILSKVLESIVYGKIIDFIRPKLSKSQFGFLSNRSSTSQLLCCYNRVMKGFDAGLDSDVIYLDLRKAFDSVAHQELLYKLWRIGITGSLWGWFQNYLLDRRHYVAFQGATSSHLSVLSGVPQGSVLGPLLFLIYIDDIHEALRSTCGFNFADDSKLLQTAVLNSDYELVQEDIDSVCTWCSNWNLCLNSNKCSHIHFSLKKSNLATPFTIGESTIQSSSSYKDLGILITSTLSWTDHINKICGKAYGALAMLRRTLPLCTSVNLKRNLYLTMVRSHLVYGSQVWRPSLIKNFIKIELVQRRATKFILGQSYSGYRDRLLELQLLPLCMWLEIHDIMFLVKMFKNPQDNFDIFQFVSFQDSQTRSSSKHHLRHNLARTSTYRHFFFNRITRLWNSLPEVDLSSSIATIRRKVLDHFWHYFVATFDSDRTCTYHLCCPCPNCYILKH